MDHHTVKRFYKKGIEKISRSVKAYFYLVLISQVQARSRIVGNSAPVIKDMFKALINEEYSIGNDIERHQGVLKGIKETSRTCIIKGRFFGGHRHIHASKHFKLRHWKDEGIQQQNFCEQHRYENWFKQRYKQGS